ncbi:hypothetical protein D3C76_1599130 [compost metagenome]
MPEIFRRSTSSFTLRRQRSSSAALFFAQAAFSRSISRVSSALKSILSTPLPSIARAKSRRSFTRSRWRLYMVKPGSSSPVFRKSSNWVRQGENSLISAAVKYIRAGSRLFR